MSSYTPTRESLNRFLSTVKLSGLTLDLGCGSARYKSLFPDRVGFDLNHGSDVDVRGDAHLLPFEDDFFEVVLCTEVLEHLLQPWQAIQEIERVLRPRGVCLLTTRFCYPIHSAPNDFYRFTEFGLRHLFRNWEILYLESDTDVISSMMVMFWYSSGEFEGNMLGRLFLRLGWTPLWKFYFRLYPRLKGIQPSLHAPTGYHLIARKCSS